MISIAHDLVFDRGVVFEVAAVSDLSVRTLDSATKLIACTLLEEGEDPNTSLEIVRLNPYLFSGPKRLVVSVRTASLLPFFSRPEERDEYASLMREAASQSSGS